MPRAKAKPNADTAAPNDPAPTGAPSRGSPSASAKGPTLDLSKYRKAAAAPAAVAAGEEKVEKPKRDRRPKVGWAELAGIDGVRIADYWTGTSEYGPYVGASLLMPDGAECVALAQGKTQAGAALMAAISDGRLNGLDADPPVPVPVHVRARKSRDHPEGRPMALLTIG